MVGRLTHPMAYHAASDHYVPVSWDEAFAIIGRHLNALPDPNMAAGQTDEPDPGEDLVHAGSPLYACATSGW
jgi:anaerobic selenocysteine-containing dehydrogenase